VSSLPRTVLYTVCFSDFYGTQRNVFAAARRLDPNRYRPIVAAPEGDFFNVLKESGIAAIPLPFKGVADFSTALALRRIIRDNKVSLVHAHLGISAVLSLLASGMAGGVPVIATRHFIDHRYSTIKNKLLYNVYRLLYIGMNARLKRVIFVSEAVRRGVESREGSLGDRGVVIYNSVDLSEGLNRLNMAAGDIEVLKAAFGAPPGCFLVVTLSRLVAEKRIDTLLEAAAALKEKGGRYFFLIAGDGPLRCELEEKAGRLGVRDSVRFLGYVKEARELAAAADAFALPAEAEPFGIAVIEAMAAGTPVVAARAGGPLEIINEGVNGLFFSPGDSIDLAEKLSTLAGDSVLRNSIAVNARTRAGDFDEREIALKIQYVYDQVLG